MALRFVHSDSKQAHLHWSDRDESQTGVDGYTKKPLPSQPYGFGATASRKALKRGDRGS